MRTRFVGAASSICLACIVTRRVSITVVVTPAIVTLATLATAFFAASGSIAVDTAVTVVVTIVTTTIVTAIITATVTVRIIATGPVVIIAPPATSVTSVVVAVTSATRRATRFYGSEVKPG